MLKYLYILIFIFSTSFGVVVFADVSTSTANILKGKIDERNIQIKKLEDEIKQYNIEVDSASKQATTLKSTIKTLDLTKKRINTDIVLTERKINKTELTIQQLNEDVASTSDHIDRNKNALSQMLQNMQIIDILDIFQTILSRKNISEVWSDVENIKNIQQTVASQSNELHTLKTDMESKQTKTQTQKTQLVGLKTDLNGKKQAVVEFEEII